MGQAGFGADSEAKLVSQFMQTKFLCHKKSQNTPILSVSYLSDCNGQRGTQWPLEELQS